MDGFQEFPKCLHKGGDPAGDWAVVWSPEEEGHARGLGYAFIGDAAEEQKPEEGGMDALKAEAEALGIKVDARWGAKRLQSEIDKAKGE